jgi:undecaprenyl-phosphate 4-deoxy-4-formamido-L-arabinose transferase
MLVERLVAVLELTGLSYELICVEDGSPDKSWEVLADLQQAHAGRMVAVQLMRNYGQHNALMCGFRQCRGAYVITLDDDLQNPPEEIPKLLEAIQGRDLDLVYGVSESKKHNAVRNIGSAVINWVYRVAFRTSARITSYRIMRHEVVDCILSYSLNFTFIDGLLAWNTQRVGSVGVEHHERASGGSGYSPGKLVLHGMNVLTNFSLLPLQIVSFCGILAAVSGLTLGVYYLLLYFCSTITVPGYASIIVAVLVLGGVQLLSLGIIGEYLGRLHLNVNRKPQYVVRQVLEEGRPPLTETACTDSAERESGRTTGTGPRRDTQPVETS